MPIKLLQQRTVLKTHPFDVQELDVEIDGERPPHPYYRLHCPDWVNILPVTTDRKVVLIRQPRAGEMRTVLELPGGCVDPGENDVTMAAVRELEEETGYTSQRLLPIGSLNPNPAIQDNRCHFFLALGCHLNPDRRHFPDDQESIEVELVPQDDLLEIVRTGQMNHALCALNVMLAMRYLEGRESAKKTLEPRE